MGKNVEMMYIYNEVQEAQIYFSGLRVEMKSYILKEQCGVAVCPICDIYRLNMSLKRLFISFKEINGWSCTYVHIASELVVER